MQDRFNPTSARPDGNRGRIYVQIRMGGQGWVATVTLFGCPVTFPASLPSLPTHPTRPTQLPPILDVKDVGLGGARRRARRLENTQSKVSAQSMTSSQTPRDVTVTGDTISLLFHRSSEFPFLMRESTDLIRQSRCPEFEIARIVVKPLHAKEFALWIFTFYLSAVR